MSEKGDFIDGVCIQFYFLVEIFFEVEAFLFNTHNAKVFNVYFILV